MQGSGTPSTRARKVMAIAPISASTAQTSTGIPVEGFDWMDIALLVGTMSANATIDLTIEGSSTLGGTYTAITGGVMAQRVAASHASKIWTGEVNLRNTSYKFIRVVATCATAASLIAVECVLTGADRTERVYGTQLGSSPAASPLSATDVLFSI